MVAAASLEMSRKMSIELRVCYYDAAGQAMLENLFMKATGQGRDGMSEVT